MTRNTDRVLAAWLLALLALGLPGVIIGWLWSR
jgi:hypothetical protein